MCKGFSQKWLDFVYGTCENHAKKVMAFWIIASLIGCYWGLDLPNYCVFEFLPPKGSQSDIAYNKITEYFPQFLFKDYEIIIIQTYDGENIINDDTKSLLLNINRSLWHDINPSYNILQSFSTYYDYSDEIEKIYPIYPFYKERFVNNANDTMICFVSLDINGIEQDTINGFIDLTMDTLSNTTYKNKYKMLSLTGALTMWNQGMHEMQNDMTTKDMMMMPFIFALMMYMVGSWRFILIVGPVLGMAIIISMSTFVPFAKYNVFELNPMVPSIMLFLCMALSVDYSMFLLSRFSSEVVKGTDIKDAVREMIRYSAHVVILSGMVLIVSWFGVTFIPFSGMDTLGLGSIFTIFFCVIINISFTASSILAFPNFFGKLEILPTCCMIYCCCCCEADEHGLASKTLQTQQNHGSLLAPSAKSINSTLNKSNRNGGYQPIESIISHPSHTSMYHRDHRDHENAQNWYFKLTQFTTKFPFNIIVPIIIYAAMSPAIYVLFTDYKYSMDFTAYFPNDSSSVQAYKVMMTSFPAGDLWPYYILGVTSNENNKNNKIWTNEFYQTFCYSAREIMANYDIPSYHFHSVTFAPNISNINNISNISNINISETEIFCMNKDYIYNGTQYSMVNGMKLFYENGSNYVNPNDPYYIYYEYIDQYLISMISESETASIISFVPPFNPLLQSAVKPSRDIRSLIEGDINSNKSISNITTFYMHNSLYWQIDSLTETYKLMPWIMLIIVIVIFILIATMFHAYLLPLRLIFVVLIPISFVYGIAVGIYCDGWLNWLNWNALKSGDGIIWILPCITTSILMGLAMDYEIFLFSRIFEYRYKGYNSRASIILAVANTGPIISSAGTVMIMAFFGMLLQNIICSNQMGFLFVFGVFIDTFIIRPLLVPSMSSLADWLNWWPNLTTNKHLMNEYGDTDKTIIN